MNFRKPRDSGLVKRTIRLPFFCYKHHLTPIEIYHIQRSRYVTKEKYEEIKKRFSRYTYF